MSFSFIVAKSANFSDPSSLIVAACSNPIHPRVVSIMGTLTGAVVHHRQLHLVLRYPFVSVYKMGMKWLASSLFQGVANTRFVW
jgi:hypothetical protein